MIDRLGKPADEFFEAQGGAQGMTDPRFLFPILEYLPWMLVALVYLDSSVRFAHSLTSGIWRDAFCSPR